MNITAAWKQEEGFSMTELMVVLVIIGILTLLALPRFLNVTTNAKMTEAKGMLRQVYAEEMSYYFEHDEFAPDLETLRFEQAKLTTDGGDARYRISIEGVEGFTFTAIATSVVDFDKDGVFNVWEVNQEGLIRERTPD